MPADTTAAGEEFMDDLVGDALSDVLPGRM